MPSVRFVKFCFRAEQAGAEQQSELVGEFELVGARGECIIVQGGMKDVKIICLACRESNAADPAPEVLVRIAASCGAERVGPAAAMYCSEVPRPKRSG